MRSGFVPCRRRLCPRDHRHLCRPPLTPSGDGAPSYRGRYDTPESDDAPVHARSWAGRPAGLRGFPLFFPRTIPTLSAILSLGLGLCDVYT